MPNFQVDTSSDFGAFAAILRRRLWLLVVAVVAAIGAALFYSAQQPEQYESTAVLLFRQVLLDVQLTGDPLLVPSSDATVESATNVGLVSQENVRIAAAARLGPGYTADELEKQVQIEPQRKSNLVGIQATAGSAKAAAKIANAMAQSYLDIANQQNVARINAAANRVRSRINGQVLPPEERTSLRAALVKLTVLSSLGPQYVHLVQAAVAPTKRSAPKPLRNALIGGVIGLVIGLALMFGVELADRRLRLPEELERETGLPLLATVPASPRLRRPLLGRVPDDGATEPFHQLASHLRHAAGDREIRSVLLVSAGAGAGTTTVALHLATVAAEGFAEPVLLLEANLRRPGLGRLLGLASDRGLGSLATAGRTSEPVIQTVDLDPGAGSDGDGALAVLLAGPSVENAAGLLESDAVRDLVRSSRERYELTVVDAPPLLLVADAIPLAKAVDAVVVVVRLGADTGPEVRRLCTELSRLGIAPLGVVANCARGRANPYASIRRG